MSRRPPRTLAPAVLAVAVLLAGCGGAEPPSNAPAAVDAPTELDAGAVALQLSTYAWQDQMPTVGDEPGPCASLCVNGTVEVVGGGPLPDDLEVVDIVAIVDGDEIAFEEQEYPGSSRGPSNYEFVGRRGPALEPGTTLDLAVKLEVGGEERWLRAADVTIERTV